MKDTMRKPTYSEIYMYKSLFWLSVAVFIFCPAFNNLILKYLTSFVASNIAYEALVLPLLICQAIISFLPLYCGFGILVVCFLYFGKNAKGVIALYFISVAVDYFTVMLGEYFASGSVSAVGNLITSLTTASVYLLMFIFVIIYAKKSKTYMNIGKYELSKEIFKHPFTKGSLVAVGTYCIIHVLVQIVNMLVYYLDKKNYYNIPSGFSEIMSDIVFPYFQIILLAALGFLIMIVIGFLAQKIKNSAKKKFLKLNKKSAE